MFAHVSGYSHAEKDLHLFEEASLDFSQVRESQVLQNTKVYEESFRTKALQILQ